MSTITDTVHAGGIVVSSVVYMTPELDLSQIGSIVVAAGIAGKTFVPTRYGFLSTTVAGTATGPATCRMGTASSDANMLTSTAAVLSTAQHAVGLNNYAAASVNSGTKLFPGESTIFKITAGATGTGGFAWKAKLVVWGVYI